MQVGAKYRPGSGPTTFTADTRDTILTQLQEPIAYFAKKAEGKIAIPGVMSHWQCHVRARIVDTLDAVPLGTSTQACASLQYTPSDTAAMHEFLNRYQGHGVVCTTMDKAANTMVFRCPKAYVTDAFTDFDSASVYAAVHDDPAQLVQSHNSFLAQFGVPADPACQSIPHYVATMKMHKQPPGCRFISSSACSSVKTVSVWLNRLFNALLPELDSLFAVVMKQAGISQAWTHRSWILRSTADVIPLVQAWNQLYASRSSSSAAQPPSVETFDFERLYTNIDTSDMQSSIMQLVQEIFSMPQHQQHAGIKVCSDKAAQWLKQAKMPTSDFDRYGRGDSGEFFIFDMHTISTWLSFLLHNMLVTFGGVQKKQVKGTPMGTNCASHLANFFLAMYELRFLRNLSNIIRTPTAAAELRRMARYILYAFLLTGRYIDDLLAINNPYLPLLRYNNQTLFYPEIHGIYPPSLSLTCTSAGTSASYMDISITPSPHQSRPHSFTTVLYDKREHPPLSALFIIKFPHISSNISATAKYGIITSQFHRYRRIVLWREDFESRMARLMRELEGQGYDRGTMKHQLQRLCRKYNTIYGTYADTITQAVFHRLA